MLRTRTPSCCARLVSLLLNELLQIDGVQRDGARTFRASNKVSAMIPAAPESGGGDVGIVVTIFRISRHGLDEKMEREFRELPDLLVVLRRKGGDYYR